MDKELQRLIDRFYEMMEAEMDEDINSDLGKIACRLVPKLLFKINKLEKEISWLYEDMEI